MKVVWEYEIEQTFRGGITECFTERFVGTRDLISSLVNRKQKWLSQVYIDDDKAEIPCIAVTVLSAQRICELTG